MALIELDDINASYLKITTSDPGCLQELKEYFTFTVPGSEFSPSVRNGFWDGKIRLIDSKTNTLISGLASEVIRFAREVGHEVSYSEHSYRHFTEQEVLDVATKIGMPLEIRPYQMQAILQGLNYGRHLLLSPTASGKSMIIYMIVKILDLKTLIIVPKISLVDQMTSDFSDYGLDVDAHVHKVYGGRDPKTTKKITISTWQSLYKLEKKFFHQFDVVIGDECHLFSAKSLNHIMGSLINAYYRIGLTGSLDGSKTNEMVIRGLFGPIYVVSTTRELMDAGYVSELDINCIVVNYEPEVVKRAHKLSYPEELSFLFNMEERNKLIANMALHMKGNVLILCQYVKEHAIPLHALVREIIPPERNVYLIIGKVNPVERERIRKILDQETDAILIASVQAFATGSNVKNLRHLIFTAPTKAMVTTLQSIGRVIRKSPTKSKATLHDLVDNLAYRGRQNFAMKHFKKRMEIYAMEQFPFKIKNIGLKNE